MRRFSPADLPDTLPVFPLPGARAAAAGTPAAQHLRATLPRDAGRCSEVGSPADRHDPAIQGRPDAQAPQDRLRRARHVAQRDRGRALPDRPDRASAGSASSRSARASRPIAGSRPTGSRSQPTSAARRTPKTSTRRPSSNCSSAISRLPISHPTGTRCARPRSRC